MSTSVTLGSCSTDQDTVKEIGSQGFDEDGGSCTQ